MESVQARACFLIQIAQVTQLDCAIKMQFASPRGHLCSDTWNCFVVHRCRRQPISVYDVTTGRAVA